MIAALVFLVTGYVDVPRLVAADPFYPAVVQYDREIAGLRATERVPGLTAIAADVNRDAASLENGTRNASRSARSDAARPTPALGGAGNFSSSYRQIAGRTAASTLAAYRAAMAQRTQRALDARAQQFREKESTLGFDLAKRDGARRLLLTLKLSDLHVDASHRTRLQAQLSALDARERDAVAAMRRSDDAALAAYAAQLREREAADDARMEATVARTTQSTLADRTRIAQSPPLDTGPLQRMDPSASASDVAAALDRAGADLGRRFAELARADGISRNDTHARIAALEAARRRIYGAIVARIEAAAQRVARERHIASIVYGGKPPPHAVDLTRSI